MDSANILPKWEFVRGPIFIVRHFVGITERVSDFSPAEQMRRKSCIAYR